MAKKYDDFDDAGDDRFFDQILTIVSCRKRGFAIGCVVAAVALLGLIVWGSYPESEQVAATESVPIVRADAGAYKTLPDNPGGMEIPYRDSTVFDAATQNAGNAGQTENILADDSAGEQPMPRSELFAGLNTVEQAPQAETAFATAPMNEIDAAKEFAKAEPVLPPSNDALVSEAIGVPPSIGETIAQNSPAPAESLPTPVAEKTPEIAKEAAQIESAAGAATAAKAVSPGNAFVQIASVKSESGAAGEFKKLQAKYPGLSGLSFRTQEANLGAKGIFYRIQAGPMDRAAATALCNDIKKTTPGGCLVVTK
jgi:hypothetical protein